MKKEIDSFKALELTKGKDIEINELLNKKYEDRINKLQQKIDNLEKMLFKYNIGDYVIDKNTFNIYRISTLIQDRKIPTYGCNPYYFDGESCFTYNREYEDHYAIKDDDSILGCISVYNACTYRNILKAKFVYKWTNEKIKECFCSK